MAKAAYPTIGIAAFVMFGIVYFIGCLRYNFLYLFMSYSFIGKSGMNGKCVCTPLKKIKVTSPFRMCKDPFIGKIIMHNGIDFHAYNDEVYAMLSGVVKKVEYVKRSVNFIILQHENYSVDYCHFSRVTIKEKMPVLAGDVVGIMGNTGCSTGDIYILVFV